MASFPPPGSLTLCELNRELSILSLSLSLSHSLSLLSSLTLNFSAVTVDALSDDRANQTYGKLLVIYRTASSYSIQILFIFLLIKFIF